LINQKKKKLERPSFMERRCPSARGEGVSCALAGHDEKADQKAWKQPVVIRGKSGWFEVGRGRNGARRFGGGKGAVKGGLKGVAPLLRLESKGRVEGHLLNWKTKKSPGKKTKKVQ